MPQAGLRGASRSIGRIYICKAPEIACEIIAVSPPNWLLGYMVISRRPLVSCLILSAAICACAIAGCSIGEDPPSL